MTEQETKELWIMILKPLAILAARREFMATHPDIELKLKDNNEVSNNKTNRW